MEKEDFVTYEQALALKKLGFNYQTDYLYSPEFELVKFDYNNCYEQGYYDDYADAPTLAQVQKWLRKEKKYSVQPYYYMNNKWGCLIVKLSFDAEDVYDNVTYNSPEEALSEGITECLKLLENNKPLIINF